MIAGYFVGKHPAFLLGVPPLIFYHVSFLSSRCNLSFYETYKPCNGFGQLLTWLIDNQKERN